MDRLFLMGAFGLRETYSLLLLFLGCALIFLFLALKDKKSKAEMIIKLSDHYKKDGWELSANSIRLIDHLGEQWFNEFQAFNSIPHLRLRPMLVREIENVQEYIFIIDGESTRESRYSYSVCYSRFDKSYDKVHLWLRRPCRPQEWKYWDTNSERLYYIGDSSSSLGWYRLMLASTSDQTCLSMQDIQKVLAKSKKLVEVIIGEGWLVCVGNTWNPSFEQFKETITESAELQSALSKCI